LEESFLYILSHFLNERFFLFNAIFEFLTDGFIAQSLRCVVPSCAMPRNNSETGNGSLQMPVIPALTDPLQNPY